MTNQFKMRIKILMFCFITLMLCGISQAGDVAPTYSTEKERLDWREAHKDDFLQKMILDSVIDSYLIEATTEYAATGVNVASMLCGELIGSKKCLAKIDGEEVSIKESLTNTFRDQSFPSLLVAHAELALWIGIANYYGSCRLFRLDVTECKLRAKDYYRAEVLEIWREERELAP